MLIEIIAQSLNNILTLIVIATFISVVILIASIWKHKPKYRITGEELKNVTFYYVEQKELLTYLVLFSTANKSEAHNRLQEHVKAEAEKSKSKN